MRTAPQTSPIGTNRTFTVAALIRAPSVSEGLTNGNETRGPVTSGGGAVVLRRGAQFDSTVSLAYYLASVELEPS